MVTFDMARKCKREGRKTLSTEDLFQSLTFLGNAVCEALFMCYASHYFRSLMTISGFGIFVPYVKLHVRAARMAKAVSFQMTLVKHLSHHMHGLL